MALQLRCMVCNESHKADTKRFPYTKHSEREVYRNGVKEKEIYVEGHICKKCIVKELRRKQNA